VFRGIDGHLGGGTHTGCGGLLGCETYFTRGTGYDGASNNWQWRRLNDSPIGLVAGTEYTLNFWAGGAEFAVLPLRWALYRRSLAVFPVRPRYFCPHLGVSSRHS
jgi:hypothetical protein